MCARLNVLHKTLEVVTDPLSSCLKNDADFCSLVLMIFFFPGCMNIFANTLQVEQVFFSSVNNTVMNNVFGF